MEPRRMMGLDDPGDQRVSITVRDWNGLKLALWRSKVAWEIAARQAAEIVERCEHNEGCPALQDEAAPCLSDRYETPDSGVGSGVTPDEEGHVQASLVDKGCPDRETRMSALVILNAARMFAPIDARQVAAERYWAPGREYFSAMVAELASAQAELDAIYEAMRAAGVQTPEPPARPEIPTLPRRRAVAQLPPAQPKEST